MKQRGKRENATHARGRPAGAGQARAPAKAVVTRAQYLRHPRRAEHNDRR